MCSPAALCCFVQFLESQYHSFHSFNFSSDYNEATTHITMVAPSGNCAAQGLLRLEIQLGRAIRADRHFLHHNLVTLPLRSSWRRLAQAFTTCSARALLQRCDCDGLACEKRSNSLSFLTFVPSLSWKSIFVHHHKESQREKKTALFTCSTAQAELQS